MKLYLLEIFDCPHQEYYESCVVCAENEEEAKNITPPHGAPFVAYEKTPLHLKGFNSTAENKNTIEHKKLAKEHKLLFERRRYTTEDWAEQLSEILCTEIGTANDNQKKGVIIASYVQPFLD